MKISFVDFMNESPLFKQGSPFKAYHNKYVASGKAWEIKQRKNEMVLLVTK